MTASRRKKRKDKKCCKKEIKQILLERFLKEVVFDLELKSFNPLIRIKKADRGTVCIYSYEY